jgi:hypothetical protein
MFAESVIVVISTRLMYSRGRKEQKTIARAT